jgi:hypothetical protein
MRGNQNQGQRRQRGYNGSGQQRQQDHRQSEQERYWAQQGSHSFDGYDRDNDPRQNQSQRGSSNEGWSGGRGGYESDFRSGDQRGSWTGSRGGSRGYAGDGGQTNLWNHNTGGYPDGRYYQGDLESSSSSHRGSYPTSEDWENRNLDQFIRDNDFTPREDRNRSSQPRTYGGERGDLHRVDSYDWSASGGGSAYGRPSRSQGFTSGSGRERYGYGGQQQGDPQNSWRGSDSGAGSSYARSRGNPFKGFKKSDQRLTEDLGEALMDDGIDCGNVEVQIKDGVVTLTGEVNDRTDKYRIEQIAADMTGVSDVENQIRLAKRGSREESSSGSGRQSDTSSSYGQSGTSSSGSSASTGSSKSQSERNTASTARGH